MLRRLRGLGNWPPSQASSGAVRLAPLSHHSQVWSRFTLPRDRWAIGHRRGARQAAPAPEGAEGLAACLFAVLYRFVLRAGWSPAVVLPMA